MRSQIAEDGRSERTKLLRCEFKMLLAISPSVTLLLHVEKEATFSIIFIRYILFRIFRYSLPFCRELSYSLNKTQSGGVIFCAFGWDERNGRTVPFFLSASAASERNECGG